jgi:hypothetical protein
MVEDSHSLAQFETVVDQIRKVGEIHVRFVLRPFGSVIFRGFTLLVVYILVRNFEIGE